MARGTGVGFYLAFSANAVLSMIMGLLGLVQFYAYAGFVLSGECWGFFHRGSSKVAETVARRSQTASPVTNGTLGTKFPADFDLSVGLGQGYRPERKRMKEQKYKRA